MDRTQPDHRAAAALEGEIPVSGPSRPSMTRRQIAGSLLRATRPRQWPKNALVFAAPAAAGVIVHPRPLALTIAAFSIFVSASASTYLVNDIIDRNVDRLHPVKAKRPIASGQLQPRPAVITAAALALASVIGGAFIAASLAVIVGAYLVISLAYSLGLKRVPLLELACVGSGFTLRAVAGGAATHVPISPWFLVMTSFGALFVVVGKRSSEQQVLGAEQVRHRATLGSYPAWMLHGLRLLAIAVTTVTYVLWTFERARDLHPADHVVALIWFELSIVPFVLALALVERAISRGRGGEPEELVLTDHVLQGLGVAWLALLLCGIYA